jgi:hypothetical protein
MLARSAGWSRRTVQHRNDVAHGAGGRLTCHTTAYTRAASCRELGGGALEPAAGSPMRGDDSRLHPYEKCQVRDMKPGGRSA